METININYGRICRPAVVYFVIATILACAALLIAGTQGSMEGSLGNFSSHMLSIILCSLILMGICNIYPGLSWAFVVLFILCNVSAIIALFGAALGLRSVPTVTTVNTPAGATVSTVRP